MAIFAGSTIFIFSDGDFFDHTSETVLLASEGGLTWLGMPHVCFFDVDASSGSLLIK